MSGLGKRHRQIVVLSTTSLIFFLAIGPSTTSATNLGRHSGLSFADGIDHRSLLLIDVPVSSNDTAASAEFNTSNSEGQRVDDDENLFNNVTTAVPITSPASQHHQNDITTASTTSFVRQDESRNFQNLEKSVKAVLKNLSNSTVDSGAKEQLGKEFDRLFDHFRHRSFDELLSNGDQSRRLPYGIIHEQAHDIIDNMANLTSAGLFEVHRSIHYAFSTVVNDDPCYPQYSNHHTGCLERLGRGGCGKVGRGIKEEDKKAILAVHDNYRSQIARGLAAVGNVTLPSARAMKETVWSDELAKLAQAWADQCNFTYDCADCRRTDGLRYVGQNIARFKGLKHFDYQPAWRSVVASWASKIKLLPVTDGTVAKFIETYRHEDSWAPYTQLIWDSTYLIGCGFAYYKDDAFGGLFTQLYVCNYGPAGNVLGTPVYQIGRGCSGCSRGHVCEQDSKLCSFKPEEPPMAFEGNRFGAGGLHGDAGQLLVNATNIAGNLTGTLGSAAENNATSTV